MKFLIFVLILCSQVFSFSGTQHSKFCETAYYTLKIALVNQEIQRILTSKLSLLQQGSVSPDKDYSDIKVPDDILPDVLKKQNTSPIKWEHVLPNDVPPQIEKILIEFSNNVLKKKFYYADGTIVDWFDKAIFLWKANQQDSAIFYLGRCCHLIQDICVPMHCKMSSGIVDAWNVLKEEEPNQTKFERQCYEFYLPAPGFADKKNITNLKAEMNLIAKESRKELILCDGIGNQSLTKNEFLSWLTYVFPFLREDYDKAIEIANERASHYTSSLIYTFFVEIGMLP